MKAFNGDSVEPEDVLSDKEIGEFQDKVRGILVDAVNSAGGKGDRIDGGGCDSGYWPDFTLSELQQAVGMLEDIIADLRSSWIACSDRMPEIGTDVITFDTAKPTWRPREMRWAQNPHYRTEAGRAAKWRERDGSTPHTTPTHWMPMPAPPVVPPKGDAK